MSRLDVRGRWMSRAAVLVSATALVAAAVSCSSDKNDSSDSGISGKTPAKSTTVRKPSAAESVLDGTYNLIWLTSGGKPVDPKTPTEILTAKPVCGVDWCATAVNISRPTDPKYPSLMFAMAYDPDASTADPQVHGQWRGVSLQEREHACETLGDPQTAKTWGINTIHKATEGSDDLAMERESYGESPCRGAGNSTMKLVRTGDVNPSVQLPDVTGPQAPEPEDVFSGTYRSVSIPRTGPGLAKGARSDETYKARTICTWDGSRCIWVGATTESKAATVYNYTDDGWESRSSQTEYCNSQEKKGRSVVSRDAVLHRNDNRNGRIESAEGSIVRDFAGPECPKRIEWDVTFTRIGD